MSNRQLTLNEKWRKIIDTTEENFIERKKKAFETIRKIRVKQKGVFDYKVLINDGRKY